MAGSKADLTPSSFLEDLDHPHKDALLRVRELFLGADPSIQEGIKWNSLSFRTTEWFATFNWREKSALQFVLHLGAKVKAETAVSEIGDAGGLLKWLGKDRALLTLRDAEEVEPRSTEITSLIQEWIKHV